MPALCGALDQTSSTFTRSFRSLIAFTELKSTVNKISSKQGGYTENEVISLDVIVTGSMSPTTFQNGTYDDFRSDWGVQFDYNTL